MPLEEVIRRNRWRILAVMAVAALNYWIVLSIVAGVMAWGLVFKVNEDASIPGRLIVTSSVAAGLLLAAAVIGRKLRTIRPRVIGQLGAVEIAPGEFPQVQNLLEGLAIAAGTSPLAAALLSDDAPNGLAVGRSPADTTIVITTGLVELLTRDELEAVLAVEMCAVRRLDTALQTVAMACTSGAISVHHFWREDWKDPRTWMMIVVTWPMMVFGELLRRSAMRSSDFSADDLAMTLTRHPDALRTALTKIRYDTRTVATLSPATAPLWFEPVPHDDEHRAAEFRKLRFTPDLDERIDRIAGRPGVRQDTVNRPMDP